MIICYSVSVFGYVERSNYKSNQCFLIALMKRIMEIKGKKYVHIECLCNGFCDGQFIGLRKLYVINVIS